MPGFEPTNADIMREVKSMHSILADHETRLKAVEVYKTSQEAVANYVAKYGTREQKEGNGSNIADINKDLLKLLVQIVGIVSLLGSIIYLIINKGSL